MKVNCCLYVCSCTIFYWIFKEKENSGFELSVWDEEVNFFIWDIGEGGVGPLVHSTIIQEILVNKYIYF